MYPLLPILALLLQNTIFVSSTPAAALLGPGYPPPTDLTSNCSLVSGQISVPLSTHTLTETKHFKAWFLI